MNEFIPEYITFSVEVSIHLQLVKLAVGMGLDVERIEKEGDCAALWCRDLDVTPCVVGVFTWPARACDPTTLSSVGAITGCQQRTLVTTLTSLHRSLCMTL